LDANRTRITTPTRLTLSEGRNYPTAWTTDSKAVLFQSNRNGHWGIFKQLLNDDTAEPIATGGEDAYKPRISPDGAWVVYIARPREQGLSAPVQIMRVPLTGGAPQLVLTAHAYGEHRCAKSPAKFCAIAEQTSDRKQLVFTAFDPLTGRGRELSRFDTDSDPNAAYGWDLSPDGTRIAVFKDLTARIYILSFSGQQPREISVKGWKSLHSVDWAADGKRLFVSSPIPEGADLLQVDLRGNTHLIWHQRGNTAPSTQPGFGGPSVPWAVPSPDGRHLAIYGWSLSANIWMIENF
jgi:eukaryotic-like serine/threonine-protein kinase